MSSIKLSICISVHNTEKYLERCIESVLSQTLLEKEIIIVNNGSTDSSLDIMMRYKNRYPELIKIISQEDKGLAQGRQTGINNALGDYVTFLDADDYVKPQAYEEMLKCAIENNVDIVECQTLRDNKIIESRYNGIQNTEQILMDYFKYSEIPTMLWLRIYKRCLFEKPVLPNIYTNNEDNFAFPCLLHKARNIFYLKKQLHHYSTDNETAVMHRINNKSIDQEKIVENRKKALKVIVHVKDFIGQEVIEEKYAEEYQIFSLRIIMNFCTYDFEKLSAYSRITIVLDMLGISKKELIERYNYLNFYPTNWFAKMINIFGWDKGLTMYLIIKKLKKKGRG